jgi:TRAP-type C4-dicarboxylate transport system permease small subunit
MKVKKKAGTIFDSFISLLAFLADAMIIFTMLAVCMEIVIRLILGKSLPWVTEIVGYCLLWLTFLGAAWVLKMDGHIKMDIVVKWLHPRNETRLRIITSFIGAIVCLIVTVYSARVTWQHFETDYRLPYYLELPSYLLDCIIPIGCFLLFVQFLKKGMHTLRATKPTTTEQNQHS